jgi:hypothetical protein
MEGYMKKQKQSEIPKVNHSYKWHAEIKVETENGFMYVNAVGSSKKDLMKDIKSRLNQYKDREPEVVEILKVA